MHLATLVYFAVLQAYVFAEVNVTFSAEQQFYHLTTDNFYLNRAYGVIHVYEFYFTARPGNQVYLYLFTNNIRQYTIKVHDGNQEIDVQSYIPINNKTVVYPDPIVATSGKLFVEVMRSDAWNVLADSDFQALATDFSQKDCGKMVISTNPKAEPSQFELKAPCPPKPKFFLPKQHGKCYYVIYANDKENSPFLTQTIETGLDGPVNYNIYKGLYIDKEHALINYDGLRNVQATDKYIIINPSEDLSINHSWKYSKKVAISEVFQSTHDSLMTVDYLQDQYGLLSGHVQQSFVVRKNDPVTSVQIIYFNLLGASSLQVTPYINMKPVAEPVTKNEFHVMYFGSQFEGSFNVTYTNCDTIYLTYTTENRQLGVDSGFYGFIADNSEFFFSTETVKSDTTIKDSSTTDVKSTTDMTSTVSSDMDQITTIDHMSSTYTSKTLPTNTPRIRTSTNESNKLQSLVNSVMLTIAARLFVEF